MSDSENPAEEKPAAQEKNIIGKEINYFYVSGLNFSVEVDVYVKMRPTSFMTVTVP